MKRGGEGVGDVFKDYADGRAPAIGPAEAAGRHVMPVVQTLGGGEHPPGERGETPVSPFTTRETVLMLTLASAATSLIVGRDLSASSVVNVSLLDMKRFRLHARSEFSRCSLNRSVLYRQRCQKTTLSLCQPTELQKEVT